MPTVSDERCASCRWHSEDKIFCENPESTYYTWFRNDWKWCDKYEPKKEEEK